MVEIERISQELKSNYDYIEKMDAIKFIKTSVNDKVSINECIVAWRLAYCD